MFRPSKDWQNNACINFGNNQQYAYSLGYKEAADFLANNASDANAQDLFIFPIAFLYRHHLELQLKLIIESGNQLLDSNDVSERRDLHNLEKLWGIAKKLTLQVWPQGNPNNLKPIDHVISEYQKIDPQSTSFRYSKDFKGNNHLPNIKQINILFLSNSVNDAALILDNIYTELNDYLDTKGELMNCSE